MSHMAAWISRPTCVVSDRTETRAEPVDSPVYRRIYEAHGRQWVRPATVGPVPDAWPRSAETLALEAIEPLLVGREPSSVNVFVDCRSGAMIGGPAPTYRLAISAGLTAATPVCLWGQDGPELIFGLSLAVRRLLMDGTAVISVCQRIVSPDTRAPDGTSQVLGDAAAAVLVSRRPVPGSRPILATHVERARAHDSDLLERALYKAGLERRDCAWTVVADPASSLIANDSLRPATYFGVADIMVRLAERMTTEDLNGIGALLTQGRAGTSASMILGVEEQYVD